MSSILKRTVLLIALFFVGMAAAQTANVTSVAGTTAGGSIYEIAVPTPWNGNLVVYLHGIVDPAYPLMPPSMDPESDYPVVRAALLSRGFAVASSSWKSNGYAVKEAVQQTHQLRGLFVANIAVPKKVIVIGKSLGALAATKLVESYPSQYSGALLTCGPLGGSKAELQYIGDERALFDHYFPGVMPGDVNNTPAVDFRPGSETFNNVYGALLTGFYPPDYRTFQFASAAKLQATTPEEMVMAAMNGMGFSARYTADIRSRTEGHDPYGNAWTTYSGSFDDATLNTGIRRYTAAADALEYLDRNYEPSGKLQVPTVTLHTMIDPVVPMFHEGIYQQKVDSQNASQWLVQRSVYRFGHCALKPEEIVGSFDALWTWVNDPSARPQAGDITVQ